MWHQWGSVIVFATRLHPHTSKEMWLYDFNKWSGIATFTSTHLVRDVTLSNQWWYPVPFGLHPRTSWEVRRSIGEGSAGNPVFTSTHLVRGATYFPDAQKGRVLFTSTHLVRGATARYSVSRYIFTISCIRFSGLHLCIPQEVRLQDILVRTSRDFLVYFGFAQIS